MEKTQAQDQNQSQTPPKRKFTKPTVAKKYKKLLDKVEENGGKMSEAIREVGLSESLARNPQKITNSKTWQELMEVEFPDDQIAERHKQLARAGRLEQMVFPEGAKLTANKIPGSDVMSDEEITQMFAEADCRVLRIVHQEKPTTQRLVYFVSPDNLARDKALDKFYKIKGRYLDENQPPSRPQGNIYNIFFSAETKEKMNAIEGEIKNALRKPNDS